MVHPAGLCAILSEAFYNNVRKESSLRSSRERLILSCRYKHNRDAMGMASLLWCTRLDSNQRHRASEARALSS